MEALHKPNISLIGVYGKPGSGKTVLLEEVKRQAKQELFDVVVMAKVSRNPDVGRIQGEIARGLGVDLPDRITPSEAADLIKSSLSKKKALVMLDDVDVWEPGRIGLEALGIPSENQQKKQDGKQQARGGENENSLSSSSKEEEYKSYCKILLASRDVKFFQDEIQDPIEIHPLGEHESWELFKKIVGEMAESSVFKTIAEDIAKKCEGLPVAIATLANTLKTKTPQQWRITLLKLQSICTEQNRNSWGKESLREAIDLRYTDLESKELKQTLLLCSLMPRNATIQDLLKYGMGLGLFPGAKSIEEARHEAMNLVKKLRDSSFLLPSGRNMQLDMHYLIQDVAISVASADQGVLASREEDAASRNTFDRKALKKFNWIYISDGNSYQIPEELQCPQLTFFHLSNKNTPDQKMPEYLFRRTGGLKVLGLTKNTISSIPKSISHLLNLHTLCLDRCEWGDLKIGPIIGELKNLQVLSLAGCKISSLPEEIEKLIRLQLLDLSDCCELTAIPADVLSSLSQLEELYLGNSFHQWRAQKQVQINNQRRANDGSRENAGLQELKKLHKLTALEVRVHSVEMVMDGLFSTDLKRYKIFIGDSWNYWGSTFENSKILKLKIDSTRKLEYSVTKLIKKSDELHLEDLIGVKDVVNELDDNGFHELKYLQVRNAKDIQHMISNSVKQIHRKVFPILEVLFLRNLEKLERIFQGHFEATSFNKLKMITVEHCNQLKNFFSISIAKQLLQLKDIRVSECESIVEIVDSQGRGDVDDITEATEVVLLGQLRSLRLHRLPQLLSFCSQKNRSSRGKSFSSKKVLFPHLQELQLSGLRATSYRIGNLRKLIVEDCNKLEYLFSSFVFECLKKLKHLEIRKCEGMKMIIVEEEEVPANSKKEEEVILFNELNFLHIEGLRNMIGFCSGKYSLEFPSLKQLAVENCPKLMEFVVEQKATDTENKFLFDEKVAFPSLERMRLLGLKNLKMIWKKDSKDFFKLKSLSVTFCEHLMTIFPSEEFLVSLDKLKISDCRSVEKVFELRKPPNHAELRASSQSLADPLIPPIQSHAKQRDPLPPLSHPVGYPPTQSQAAMSSSPSSGIDSRAFSPPSSRAETRAPSHLNPTVSGGPDLLSHAEPTRTSTSRRAETRLPFCRRVGSLVHPAASRALPFQTRPDLPHRKFPLTELIIQQLPNLEHVWNMDIEANINFQDLKLVTISGCRSLKHLFPFSLTKRPGLLKLEKLELLDSGLEDIVAMGGENNEEPTFESLNCLILRSLPQLRCFYQGNYSKSWPKLEKFYFYRCGKANNQNELDQYKFQPHLYYEQVIHKLKKLSLTGEDIQKLMMEQKNQPLEGDHQTYNIEVLRVHSEKSTEFPVCFLERFQKLRKLVVEESNFVKLFPSNMENRPAILSEIRKLKLSSLHSLRNISSHDLSVLGNLEMLKVWDCQNLTSLSTATSSLGTLTTLDVWNCKAMTKLVSFSTAKSLRKLKSLWIRECRMVTEIVRNEEDETEGEINFEELRDLRLEFLTNLTSFYSGNCTFKFPLLERVEVNQCRKLKIFCKGHLKTQKLQKVLLEGKDKWHCEDDLNATLQNFNEEEVDYSRLKNLELSVFPELFKIWNVNPQELLSFKKLLSLEICNISTFPYILTHSMAKDLLELTTLVVKNCEMTEQIIRGEAEEVEENQLTFQELNSLTLESCSRLTSFSTGCFPLKFPSLKDVSIVNCPDMVTFALASRDEKKTASEPFFSEVLFDELKKLTISGLKNLKIIWQKPSTSSSQWLKSLENLEISKCCSLREVFDLDIKKPPPPLGNNQLLPRPPTINTQSTSPRNTQSTPPKNSQLTSPPPPPPLPPPGFIFSPLKKLLLHDLPELKHVWNQDPEDIITFSLLESVTVSGCPRLRYLFPFSLAKGNRLRRLQKLKILNSGLEEIVTIGVNDEAVRFEFNKLTCVVLRSLSPNGCFYREKHERYLPELEKFYLYSSTDVKKTDDLGLHGLPDQLTHFRNEVIQRLKKLSLTSDDIGKLCEDTDSMQGLTEKVEVLRVEHYDDESAEFPISFVEKFQGLNKLVVEYSAFQELLPTNSEEINTQTVLSKIRKLKLSKLQNLSRLWSQESALQNLETLKVWECNELTSLQIPTASFGSLQTLEVWNCKAMTKLVSSSAAQSLRRLKKLSIRDCGMMTEVVGNEVPEANHVIEFKELTELELQSIQIITSFCLGNYTFKFPMLEKIIVNQCPKLKIFCPGTLETSKFQKVKLLLEGNEKLHTSGDLSSTIKSLFEPKVEYSEQKMLKLSDYPELIEKGTLKPHLNFTQLTSLEICNVISLKYLLSPSMVKGLVNLTRLVVKNCETMEHIITGVTEVEAITLTFQNLDFVTLKSCPKLTSFSSGSYSLGFPSLVQAFILDCPNATMFASSFSKDEEASYLYPFFSTEVEFSKLNILRLSSVNIQQLWLNQPAGGTSFLWGLTELVVEGCSKLKYLIRFSMIKSSMKLRKIVVRNCEMMKEIIVAEDLVKEKSLFPELISVELNDLPELARFCRASKSKSTSMENTPLCEFPKVKKLKFSKLPKLQSFFPPHATKWPSLESVSVDGCKQLQIFASELPSFQRMHLESQPESQTKYRSKEQSFLNNKGSQPEAISNYYTILKVSVESFESLSILEVSGTSGLGLMTYSIAMHLKKLSRMSVTDCSMLKEIIACGVDEEKEFLVLPQLEFLELRRLPNLESFCSKKCNFKFPSLKEISVSKCPKMRTFTAGVVKAKQLNKVKLAKSDVEISKDDNLNNIITDLSSSKMLVEDLMENCLSLYLIGFIIICIGMIFWLLARS